MLVNLGEAEKYDTYFFGDKKFAKNVHSGIASKPIPYDLTEIKSFFCQITEASVG